MKLSFDTVLKAAMVVLVGLIFAMCLFGCKKADPQTIQFRLNQGRNCEIEIWEYRSAPKEATVYRNGLHSAVHSDYLPYKVGYTYMFLYSPTSGVAIEGEILLDGKSVGKSNSNSVTYK